MRILNFTLLFIAMGFIASCDQSNADYGSSEPDKNYKTSQLDEGKIPDYSAESHQNPDKQNKGEETLINTSNHSYSMNNSKMIVNSSRENRSNSDMVNNKIFELLEDSRGITRVDDSDYDSYDFTSLIADSSYDPVIGIIGKDYQRLLMQIKVVNRSNTDGGYNGGYNGIYKVFGLSETNNNRCDFVGEIKLKDIYEYEQLDYGVDEEYKDKGLRHQGFAVLEYEIKEQNNQKYSGVFKGNLYLRWYRNDSKEIYYDNINYYSDSYVNNIYYGTWQEYGKKPVKIASWADFKLPKEIAPDLNIGVGAFSPNSKYFDKGWGDYPD